MYKKYTVIYTNIYGTNVEIIYIYIAQYSHCTLVRFLKHSYNHTKYTLNLMKKM